MFFSGQKRRVSSFYGAHKNLIINIDIWLEIITTIAADAVDIPAVRCVLRSLRIGAQIWITLLPMS